MNLYKTFILPKIIDRICSSGPMTRQRKKIIPKASGHVLEVGIGSGLNLPFYDWQIVKSLTGLDPCSGMLSKTLKRARLHAIPLNILTSDASRIPMPSGAFDTITITYSLCTIPNTGDALKEMNRVLKSSGKLYFCEHGLAPEVGIRQWQHRLTPVWKILSGGCHLNRNTPEMIQNGGFKIKKLNAMYLPGWRPGMFNYWGTAVKNE